jgi:hypothetical protein
MTLSPGLREAPVPDRLHEVRLAEARGAAHEERVVLPRVLVGDPEGGRVSQAVRFARDELLERVGAVETARLLADLRSHDLVRGDRGGDVAVGAGEADLAVGEAGVGRGLCDGLGKALGDVVDEERRLDLDDDAVGGLGPLLRIAEPVLEVALVDARLQVVENLLP